MEIWKDITGYEGYYQVSDLGRVKSLHRNKEHILKHGYNRNGYPLVALCVNYKMWTTTVHQLVAEAFLGHKRDYYKVVVDHIDNNPKNNNASNLQLISPRQNTIKDKKDAGVYWHKRDKRWVSRIRIGSDRIVLGYFKDKTKALEAYNNKLKEITHG